MAERFIPDYAPKPPKRPKPIDLSVWGFIILSVLSGMLGVMGIIGLCLAVVAPDKSDHLGWPAWIFAIALYGSACFVSFIMAQSATRRIGEKRWL